MKALTYVTAAALLGLGIVAGAAVTQPSRAQTGYEAQWAAAGAYPTADGGEVWIYNIQNGNVKNCYWRPSTTGGNSQMRCSTTG